jgi:ABC-type cobalt transport system substrate-binding protein
MAIHFHIVHYFIIVLIKLHVVHAYNPSYSGGRDQEDCGSISKIPNTKRAGGAAQGVGPEFKPWYHKRKKKRKLHESNKQEWIIF